MPLTSTSTSLKTVSGQMMGNCPAFWKILSRHNSAEICHKSQKCRFSVISYVPTQKANARADAILGMMKLSSPMERRYKMSASESTYQEKGRAGNVHS